MSFELIEKFENKIAKFYGAPYAVAVDSCTHAIELCLRYKNPPILKYRHILIFQLHFLEKNLV